MLQYTLYAIFILTAGGLAAWASRLRAATASFIGVATCLFGGAVGLYGAGGALLGQSFETRRLLWNAPYASLRIGLDPLGALFLLPVFVVGGLIALHAFRKTPGDFAANRPREYWLYLNFTLAGAAGVVLARNAVLFLLCWEVMTVASFLLVENSQRARGERLGGWVYLTAGHLGAAALFAMFALMGTGDVLDFHLLKATGGLASVVFVLGLVGFGGKIGLAPMQAWYPEPYRAAPAHGGAVLSGVVGNMAVYGLLRLLTLLGTGAPPPGWWGLALLASGLASAVGGAARAVASRDLSRLLAWSSVENYGLVAAGVGLGLTGAAAGNGVVAYLGFAAAIFHCLNHSVVKALLFLTAANLFARTGTRNLDRMGGLLRRLPMTGALFLVGGLGAACLPPLGGFVGEFLLLMAAYAGAAEQQQTTLSAAVAFMAIAVVAVAGGLAVAAYLKAFAFAFLGNPKGPGAVSVARERPAALLPQMVLAVVAVAVAALSPWMLAVVGPTAESLARRWREASAEDADVAAWLAGTGTNVLDSAFLGSWLLAGCLAAAYLLRRFLVAGKRREVAPTWDCGYAAPDGRMQYTATSFTRPLAENFRVLAPFATTGGPPGGLFPNAGSESASETPGVERAWGFGHLFRWAAWLSGRVRGLQTGRVQVYLLYMAAVLVILLIWRLR